MSIAEMQNQAVAERLDRFAAAYLALARLLGAPADEELLTQLRTSAILDDWPLEPDPATARGLELMRSSLDRPEDPAAIALDFQWLFVGPGLPRAVAYESVYRSTEHLHFEEQTFAVRQAYEEFGLEAPNLNREPDDHIALELSFLSHVCARALDALEQADEFMLDRCLAAEQGFLSDHVLQWAPEFVDKLAAAAETDFNRGIAELLRGALSQAPLRA